MSYKVTVYFNDEDIASTRIYGANGFVNVTKYYGDSAYSASGFDGKTTFTATPGDNCDFTQWVYRVIEEGETEADTVQQFSTDNPFVFSGGASGNASIIIRAEGVVSSAQSIWTAHQEEQLYITDYEQSVDIYGYETGEYLLEPYNVHRYTVVFEYSGYAHFYTLSSIDTFGYLSRSPDFSSDYSGPAYAVASDDDSGENADFDILYRVSANTEYYIFVRGATGEETGAVGLFISEPWECNYVNFGTLSAAKAAGIYMNPRTLYCRRVVFSAGGTVTFSTAGTSVYTRGWLGLAYSWDRGEPTSYIASDGGNSDGVNFSITCEVEAGTEYYLWFRAWDYTTAGTVTLHISVPEAAVRPENFAWTYDKVQGGEFNLTAAEWNGLADKINEFRQYRGLSAYSFSTAYSGSSFMAYMYNQARLAIQEIPGCGGYIPSVSSGGEITAYMMNILVSELNVIE